MTGVAGFEVDVEGAAAAERHRTPPHDRAAPRPAGILPALRAHHLDDFLLHQLGQHTEPEPDAERQQPLLRSADQLPRRLLHTHG